MKIKCAVIFLCANIWLSGMQHTQTLEPLKKATEACEADTESLRSTLAALLEPTLRFTISQIAYYSPNAINMCLRQPGYLGCTVCNQILHDVQDIVTQQIATNISQCVIVHDGKGYSRNYNNRWIENSNVHEVTKKASIVLLTVLPKSSDNAINKIRNEVEQLCNSGKKIVLYVPCEPGMYDKLVKPLLKMRDNYIQEKSSNYTSVAKILFFGSISVVIVLLCYLEWINGYISQHIKLFLEEK